MQQSFETHEDALQRTAKAQKKKSHSPSSEKQVWNKENVEKELREWPVGTKINWTRFAETQCTKQEQGSGGEGLCQKHWH